MKLLPVVSLALSTTLATATVWAGEPAAAAPAAAAPAAAAPAVTEPATTEPTAKEAATEEPAAPAAKPAEAAPKEPEPGSEDGVRFRGGIHLEGGVMVIPEPDVVLGGIGLQGKLGVQFSHLVGLYVVPGFDVIFGNAGGVNLSSALMVDFTIADIFTVGVGPDVGVFGAISVDSTTASGIGGANYGGRLHLGVHPVLGYGDDGVRRQAFTIGLDSRFLAGPVGVASAGVGGASAEVTGFVLHTMLTIGYDAK